MSKLNFIEVVAIFVNSIKTCFFIPGVFVNFVLYKYLSQTCIASANKMMLKKLAMSKEHMKVSCGLVANFCIVLENVKESLMQRFEYRSSTG